MKKTVMKFSVSGFPADSDSVDNLLLLLEEIE